MKKVLTRNLPARIKASVVMFALLVAAASPALASPPWLTTDRLLVRLRPGASEKQGRAEIAKRGGQVVDRIDPLGMLVVKVPPGKVRAAQEALAQSPRFDLVEPEALHPPTLVPNDPLIPSEWHLAKLELFAAWDFGLGSHAIPIAILDSGVNATHADLAANIVPGWNFYNNNSDTSDIFGHGTQVAGTAAAVGNNGIGVAGVAPGCAIMPIRVAGTNGYASDAAIAQGLVWAADRGARVANLSFAGIHSAPGLQSSAQYFVSRGGLVTASAGNYGVDDGAPDSPYVVSVSATASDDARATWSSFGQYVDTAAPGSGIYSTLANGGYALVAGTSFSAPVAAGVIALIFSANPGLSSQQAETILETTADDLGSPGFDPYYGAGRVNARGAVFAAAGQSEPPPDTVPPSATITAPAGGQVLSGDVVISVNASDNQGVSAVHFYVDGQTIAVDTTAPYQAMWSTSAYSDGAHTLSADAFDSVSNWGTTNPVQVSVSNSVAAPPLDEVLPVVTLDSPSSGSTLSGNVSITATASDNVGISDVWFYVDGVFLGQDSSPPFEITWDSTGTANGAHVLTADAFDISHNWGTTQSVPIILNNGEALPFVDVTEPSAALTSPAAGATVGGYVTVAANAWDNVGISEVWFYADGQLLWRDSIPPFAASWNTNAWPDGAHTITADAFDAVGNWGTTPPVQVVVNNQAGPLDLSPPSVSLVSPLNGSVVAGPVTVTANAFDNVGVAWVTFYLDGAPLAVDGLAPYVITWNSAGVANGLHTLTADAFDGVGNWSYSSVTVNVSNGPPDVLPPTVKLTSPPKNANLTGTVLVQALATDTVGVTQVRFFVDGRLIGVDGTSPHGVSWNTAIDGTGNHDLTAQAFDAAGNQTLSQAIPVHVH